MPRLPAAIILIGLGLTGCSAMKPEDFAGAEPRLVLEEYFAGELRAWGLFQDRFGTVRRQFVVDIHGTWDGETLTLVEDFVYDDGEEERRVWEIRKVGDDRYEGTAEGVIGVAQGQTAGNAFNFRYDFDLPIGDSTWRVHFDDWMFLQPGGVLLNRAAVSKWGVGIGEASIFFQRPGQPTPPDDPAAGPARAAE